MSASRITRVSGRAIVLDGPDIDTDRIIPARFLKAITFEGIEANVFADDRKALKDAGGVHPFDRPEAAGASILVVSNNFGCGSSREHAPQALYRFGIRAIVGESFADIFFTNAMMIGLPCVTLDDAGVRALMREVEARHDTEVTVDVAGSQVSAAGRSWPATIPPHVKDALVSGNWDAAGLLLERYEEVEAVDRALPYGRR
jgi:3-isopropylmalate/(R)-2-methylmalate dehydratase small subunit